MLPGDFFLPKLHSIFFSNKIIKGSIFLKHGYHCTSLDVLDESGKIKKESSSIAFCFNPDYWLSYLFSFIFWGIILILISSTTWNERKEKIK